VLGLLDNPYSIDAPAHTPPASSRQSKVSDTPPTTSSMRSPKDLPYDQVRPERLMCHIVLSIIKSRTQVPTDDRQEATGQKERSRATICSDYIWQLTTSASSPRDAVTTDSRSNLAKMDKARGSRMGRAVGYRRIGLPRSSGRVPLVVFVVIFAVSGNHGWIVK
jgi:hypothetical protein